jgi:rhamnose utilization protein RhaD (predicted bifunctional aldolase and dehydrogenase)
MPATYISAGKVELNALREMSARLGSNPLLVQASSGNTSVKIDDVLWIKASGKWLIQAEDDDFLVPVRLTEARTCLADRTAIPETTTKSSTGLFASIETAMHAALPYRVVIHVHSVSAISWAVREDAARQLRDRLSGLSWQFIPYTASGIPLAQEIDHALSCFPQTNVFVLGNHGLVVCEDSCASAEELLVEVERHLAIEPRAAPGPDYVRLRPALDGSTWVFPQSEEIHVLGTDPIARRILSEGVLYPCQAIFLPETTQTLAPFVSPKQEACAARRELLRINDHGVLINERITRAEQEMLLGLANVIQRIDAFAPLRYLTDSEVRNVLNGGGDSYYSRGQMGDRQRISRPRSPKP